MSASQSGSQVLGLLSSAFFSAMGVEGVGVVWGCCVECCGGDGVEDRLQAVRARSVRARRRGIVVFWGWPQRGSMRKAYPSGDPGLKPGATSRFLFGEAVRPRLKPRGT